MGWKIKRSEHGHAVALVEILASGSECDHTPSSMDFESKLIASGLEFIDKPPEPVPVLVDEELNRIKEILAKADQDITEAERWEAVLKFMRRKIREGGA